MNYRIIPALLLLLTFCLIVIGYLLLHPWLIGFCPLNSYCLDDSVDFGIGKPLYWSIYPLTLLFFLLIFVKKEVFSFWWKAILPFAAIALYFVVTAPELHAFLTPDRTEMTDFMTKAIVAISLIIIVGKYSWMFVAGRMKKAAR